MSQQQPNIYNLHSLLPSDTQKYQLDDLKWCRMPGNSTRYHLTTMNTTLWSDGVTPNQHSAV